MAPYDFNLMVEAYFENRNQQEVKELMYVREICWWLYLPNADKKNRAKTKQEFMPIKGEKVPKNTARLTKSVIAKINDTMNRF